MKLRIGTRSSELALMQTKIFITKLHSIFPNIEVEVVKIKTTGDILYDTPLTAIGGKRLFLKEIEEALLDCNIDIAVHSTKDMPADLPDGLLIGCFLEREDIRDAFISLKYNSLSQMPSQSVLGTCAVRRQVLAQRINPNIAVTELRGNVLTRIDKLQNNQVDAIILAAAGLRRLQLEHCITEILDPNIFITAVGQGVICAECRTEDQRIVRLLHALNHPKTAITVNTERAFLKAIEGDCRIPIGIYTEIIEDQLSIKCFSAVDGHYREYHNKAPIEEHLQLGKQAGELLKAYYQAKAK